MSSNPLYYPDTHSPETDWPISSNGRLNRRGTTRGSIITCKRCEHTGRTVLLESNPLFGWCSFCISGASRAGRESLEAKVNWLTHTPYKGRGRK